MDDELHQTATRLLESAPASVEIPAGTGKTHLLAASVSVAAEKGARSLVLTHTHAGVDAIRKRLKGFGVDTSSYRVDTISSWAFSLASSYPSIAGIAISEVPDWSDSREYVIGATRVSESAALKRVHRSSFDYLFVDEYQDCSVEQHHFILTVAEAGPKTVVFGDRLQAIFNFRDNVLVNWDADVVTSFPDIQVNFEPRRWKGHNEALGAWLLDLRKSLTTGTIIDFAANLVDGITFISDTSPRALATIAHGFDDFDESVVLLDKWPNDVAGHASRLGGRYSVMEDINGRFMRERLTGSTNSRSPVMALPSDGDPLIALWFATFAKECVIGLAALDSTVLSRLSENRSINGLSRVGIQPLVDSLELLRLDASYTRLSDAAQVVRSLPSLKIYRWEAWRDTLNAISMSAENGLPPIENFGLIRDRLRRAGRGPHSRIASRTVLVKGLEYDHVIVADLTNFTDPQNLYVALSRARRSITLVGPRSSISLD